MKRASRAQRTPEHTGTIRPRPHLTWQVSNVTTTASLPERPPCPAGCLCRQWTNDEEIVPYRGEETPSDEELIAVWLENDCVVSFGWWVGRVYVDPRYKRVVKAVAGRFPEADLEGVTTATVMAIRQARPSMQRPISYFAASLRRAAAGDLGLHRQRRVEYVDPTEQGESIACFSPLSAEQRVQLQECIGKLSDTAQAILRAIYWGQESNAEVAAAHGIRPDSVTRRMFRIRRALADCLEDPSL